MPGVRGALHELHAQAAAAAAAAAEAAAQAAAEAGADAAAAAAAPDPAAGAAPPAPVGPQAFTQLLYLFSGEEARCTGESAAVRSGAGREFCTTRSEAFVLLLPMVCAAAPPPPPAPSPAVAAAGKGGKPDPKAKSPPGKGGKAEVRSRLLCFLSVAVEHVQAKQCSPLSPAQDAPPPPVATHTLPPFPAAVRGTALAALAQLAAHGPSAELLLAHPAIRDILTHGGPAPSPAAPPDAAAGNGTPPPPTTPPPIAEEPSSATAAAALADGGVGAAKAPALDPDVLYGLALLTQAVAVHLSSSSGTGGGGAAPPSKEPSAAALPEPVAGAVASATTAIGQQDLVAIAKRLATAAVPAPVEAPGEEGEALADAAGPALDAGARALVQAAIASLVLSLPEQDFVAPARPPLPSPPPTPPPLPLATSVFLWDALDRPMMRDGQAKLEYVA